MNTPPRSFDYLVLVIGVVAVSTAAVLIREASAPALVIAAYRLSFASIPLLAVAAVRRSPLLDRGSGRLALGALAGLLLALHFAFWIASVKQTSIVTSVALVTIQPLFVAIASGPLLGERVRGATWIGIAVASCGAVIMVSNDLGAGRETLLGDLYAVLGALFAAAYFLAGRSIRAAGEGWLAYVTVAYSVAAVALIAIALAAGHDAFGYSQRTYVYLLLLALVPQLIGHTALNRSLGYLPVIAVTIAVLGEPIGATILGVAFLDETPTWLQAIGGLVLLSGVYLGLVASLRHDEEMPAIVSD